MARPVRVAIRYQSEISDEQWLKDQAEALGVLSLKTGVNGWPDRLFLIPGGRPLFIEMKRSGDTPRIKQEHRLETLQALGYDAIWCDDRERALRAITKALASARRPKKGR